ncbi:hypothetical protein N4G70_33640 [Streptomyces sp. ASQP_92]|uniref:hypothetical protein n=1 Tax=Streptomyces sp. ASQP_92 TaxID=2979116 RepID=UPI0021BFF279|nr:hypothetical protein [Streptomyces sp. ASQP_92]MCT9093773.1 hypothetical protein [Streptomyces sp. ASQP_92]
MPVKITSNDVYDDASATLRVGRHDLERLLLEFPELLREQQPGIWSDMQDYDLSFERLADPVDVATEARRAACLTATSAAARSSSVPRPLVTTGRQRVGYRWIRPWPRSETASYDAGVRGVVC